MKKLLKIFIIIALAAILYVIFQIYKPQRNIATEDATASVTSSILLSDFSKNLNQANTKYLNKTIEISGKVTSVENDLVIIDDIISCIMLPNQSKPKTGEQVTVKGKLIGFENEILTEIKLSECIIKK